MSKIEKLFSNTLTIVFSLFFFYGEIFGIIHSVRKHSSGDAIASIAIPPWAWWRSLELFWHDDYSDIDWDKRLSSDIQTCIYFITQSIGKEANKYELNENIEQFSNKINKYPDDKKQFLIDGTRRYIDYGTSISNDFLETFKEHSKTGKFDFVFSEKTLNLETNLKNYKLTEDINFTKKGLQEVSKRMKEAFEKDQETIDQEKIEDMESTMILNMETQKKGYKRVFKSLFNEDL